MPKRWMRCAAIPLGQEELGGGLQNPAFVSERLINQGYWYFEE
jgi:50S ribosomal protein L16 3-hydroxylase